MTRFDRHTLASLRCALGPAALLLFALGGCPSSELQDRPIEQDAAALSGRLAGSAELALLLQPHDSPLPSREQLDAQFPDALGLLLELASASSNPQVRQSALSELGYFPEEARAVDRLFAVALDPDAPRTDRIGAVGGLGRPGVVSVSDADRLSPLLRSQHPGVQITAAQLLVRWPQTRVLVEELAAAADTQVDVARLAKRALETTR